MYRLAANLASKPRIARNNAQKISSNLSWRRNYAAKDIKFGVDARALMHRGPKGRNVVIEQSYGAPKVTKDGVTVAKSTEFKDWVKNVGASFVKQRTNATNDVAGDGCKSVAAGMNAMAVDSVVTNLKSRARMISTSEEIAQVGTISASGEREIGELIAKAMEKVGKEGDGKTLYNELEVVEGMKLDRGYISPDFITNPKNQKCELDDPLVLIHEKKISSLNAIDKVVELASKNQRSLLIVAEDIEREALNGLIIYNLFARIKVCAIKVPGFGENRKSNLQDLATLTGGEVITDELGMNLEKMAPEMLGTCKRVTISKDDTVILDGAGDKKAIEERCEQLRSSIELSTSDYDKKKLQERLAKLSGRVAVLKIGGASEAEVGEKKDRVTDALNATKGVVEEGFIPDIKFEDVKPNGDSEAKFVRFLESIMDDVEEVEPPRVEGEENREEEKEREEGEAEESREEEEKETTGKSPAKILSVAAKRAAQAELARKAREKRKTTSTTGSGVLKRTRMTVLKEPSSKVGDTLKVATLEKSKVSNAFSEKTRTSSDAIDAMPISSAPPSTMLTPSISTSTPSSVDKGKSHSDGGSKVTTVNFTLPSDFMADNVLDRANFFPHLRKYQLPSFRKRFQGVSIDDTGSHVAGLTFMAFQSSLAMYSEMEEMRCLAPAALEREKVAFEKERVALARLEALSVRLDDVQNDLEVIKREKDEANNRFKRALDLTVDLRAELDRTKDSLVASEKEAKDSKSRASELESEVKELKDELKSVFALARLTARAAIMRQHLAGRNPLASASDELAFYLSSVGSERDLDSDDEK